MSTNIVKLFMTGILTFVTTVSLGQNMDCQEMGLKGNVKNINETQYKLNDINPGLNEVLLTVFSFDKNCRKKEEVTTDVGGDLKDKHVITYDKSGNIASENKETPTVNGYFATRYRYDDNKRLSKKEISSNGKLLATHSYSYDDKGNVGKKEIKKQQTYDMNDESFEYKYDENNRLIEETHLDGEKYNRIEYKYNDKNQIIRRAEHNERGGVTYETDYTYDELDNPSTEISAYRGNKTFNYSYVYEYDSQGNWINKRSLSDDKTYSLQIRVITYY
jgi:hypothetical protein